MIRAKWNGTNYANEVMEKRSLFSVNLKFLRERKGASQEQLSADVGLSRSNLSAYEKGQTKNPTIEVLIKLSNYFKISTDLLLKKDLSEASESKLQDYETRSSRDISGRELRVVVTTVDITGKQNIEHVPVKAKAGYLSGYTDPEYISRLPVYSLPHLPRDKKFRSFPCQGDSMFPFPEQAVIIGEYIDDWLSLKDHSNCIVITREEGIVFKSVSNRIKERRTLVLQSLNPAYAPYEISIQDVCELWRFSCFVSDEMPIVCPQVSPIETTLHEMHTDIKYIRHTVGSNRSV